MVRKKNGFDYSADPCLYEQVEDIPGEQAMLKLGAKQLLKHAREKFKKDNERVSILDLCCGTAPMLASFAQDEAIESIIGVDINKAYLDFAKNKYSSSLSPSKLKFIQADAVHYKNPKLVDLIICSSALHHIEDERKDRFLERVKEQLKGNGAVLFLENILPSYGSAQERAVATIEFYSRRILDCIDNCSIRDSRIPLLSRVMQYERDREYEWKLDYRRFIEYLTKAGFKIIYQKKVWPIKSLFRDEKVGDFVFVVKKND